MDMNNFLNLEVDINDTVTINAVELQKFIIEYNSLKDRYEVLKKEYHINEDTIVKLYRENEKNKKSIRKLSNKLALTDEELKTLKEERRDNIKLDAIIAKLTKHNEALKRELSKTTSKLLTQPITVSLDLKG